MPQALIDCSAIPKKTYANRLCFDWARSVGADLPFRCEARADTLTITAAEKRGNSYYITVCCHGRSHTLLSSSLTAGHIGPCIGGRTLQPKLQPGQRLQEGRRDITILSADRRPLPGRPHRYKTVTFRCNRCGYESPPLQEGRVVSGSGCPVCSGKTVVPGYNDIASQAPWMVPYFPGGAHLARTFTCSSGQALRLQCPYCGRLSDRPVKIATLQRKHSIGCPCGDGVSLPEKFLFQFFRALAVPYKRQVSSRDFPWCGKYRYDGMFYRDTALYLLEIHGVQHFEHSGYERLSPLRLEDVQENDRRKQQLAAQNGIDSRHYIVLDCRRSTLAHMKDQLLASPLFTLLAPQLSDRDWEVIYFRALAPLAREIVQYAQAHPEAPTKVIAGQFGVSPAYPARVLAACGLYGKAEQERRKSKAFFVSRRAQLCRQIRQLMAQNPDITPAEIAGALGRSRSGIYAFMRKYPEGIDIARLKENAQRHRLRCTRASICKPLSVTGPDGTVRRFASLTEACRALARTHDLSLAPSSVSTAIAKGRAIHGFFFRYQAE